MTEPIQFITPILSFSLLLTACEKDSTNPDPIDPADTTTIVNCFDAIDLSGSLDYARLVNFINETEGCLFGREYYDNVERSFLHTEDGRLTWSVMYTAFVIYEED